MVTMRPSSGGSCSRLVACLLAGIPLAAGCGQEADLLDPAVSLVTQVAKLPPDQTLPPPGTAPCQRRALCVPENPCHVGQVTGCRANVPICTDLGAWQPNGTSCGEDCVCLRGQPNFCDAGAGCFPLDSWGQPDRCQLGTTVCSTGRPVCQPLGPAPDGTSCSDTAPMVCKGAVCTWCLDGETCAPPDQPCLQGTVQGCSTGGTCVAGAPQPDGTWCSGGACLGGTCNACAWWSSCDTGNPCQYGYTDCSSGVPACIPDGWAWDGMPCPGGVCQAGTCGPACVPGEPCVPDGNACATGQRNCTWPGGFCEPTGNTADGTPCGDAQVCSAGTCTACGTPCSASDLCAAPAAISCETGLCAPSGLPPVDGTSCGPAGEACAGGFCKGTAGNPLLVRTATGPAMDVAGTAWSACYRDEPFAGMSRRAIDSFGAASFAHADIVFPFALDCRGPTAQTLGLLGGGAAMTEGDRLVGWAGAPPAGLASNVTVTATYLWNLTGLDTVTSMKQLFFVNDLAIPATLYAGEGKEPPFAADGYPVAMGVNTRRLRPACVAGGACQGMGGACRSWNVTCDYLSPACVETGTAPDLTSCGAAGETCVAGDCVGIAGAALVVRTGLGGTVDLTGTSWASCRPGEPEPWMSRRKTNAFVAGAVIVGEEIYAASTDCTGVPDPILSWQATLTITLAGDRFAGWRGPVPFGLPSTLWTTGAQLSGQIPGAPGPFVAKDLVLVDTASAPWRLYTGEDDNPILLDAEGYPAYMLDGAFFLE